MTKYFVIIIIASLSFGGCTGGMQKSCKSGAQDSIHYSSLVMSVLMNDVNYLVPDYPREAELIFNDNDYYLYKSTKVLRRTFKKDSISGFTGYKEIQDNWLNLTMRVHRWNCGCEISIPNTLLYISNRKDFEYAFLFFDESRTRTNDTISEKHHATGPPSLEFQINYILNALKMNSAQSGNETERFLHLIADSLLCLKPISAADIPELQKEKQAYTKDYTGDTTCRICKEGFAAQMDTMMNELKSDKGNVLYYHGSTKYFRGYWRFEFTTRNGRLYIMAAYNKCICNKIFAD